LLGIFQPRKASLFSLVVHDTSSAMHANPAQDALCDYGGPTLTGMGIEAMLGTSTRCVRNALHIDGQTPALPMFCEPASASLRQQRKGINAGPQSRANYIRESGDLS
jgi:hypothetical protein